MNNFLGDFLNRDLRAPLSTLAGVGLIIMAGSRLAFALTASLALFWVYGLTLAVIFFAQPLYPKMGGKAVLILLAAFFGSVFLFMLSFASPLLAIQTAYIILLVPCYCVGSSLFSSQKQLEPETVFLKMSSEAGALSLLIIAFALIREPIGFTTLSVPGGSSGIIELFQNSNGDMFLPIRIVANSSGALILFGYGAALFRNIKKAGGVNG